MAVPESSLLEKITTAVNDLLEDAGDDPPSVITIRTADQDTVQLVFDRMTEDEHTVPEAIESVEITETCEASPTKSAESPSSAKKRGRGRPRKYPVGETNGSVERSESGHRSGGDASSAEVQSSSPSVVGSRKRERPLKYRDLDDQSVSPARLNEAQPSDSPKKRGRPRIYPLRDPNEPKRPVGRPRIHPISDSDLRKPQKPKEDLPIEEVLLSPGEKRPKGRPPKHIRYIEQDEDGNLEKPKRKKKQSSGQYEDMLNDVSSMADALLADLNIINAAAAQVDAAEAKSKRKQGRPKKSGPPSPKKKRGRPKIQYDDSQPGCSSWSDDRPPNKKRGRGRGRPPKVTGIPKRGRGRPKGSTKKTTRNAQCKPVWQRSGKAKIRSKVRKSVPMPELCVQLLPYIPVQVTPVDGDYSEDDEDATIFKNWDAESEQSFHFSSDEEEPTHQSTSGVKRGRGRPKGSKNKHHSKKRLQADGKRIDFEYKPNKKFKEDGTPLSNMKSPLGRFRFTADGSVVVTKRGRAKGKNGQAPPPKKPKQVLYNPDGSVLVRQRGRPRIYPIGEKKSKPVLYNPDGSILVRKRGRPRIYPIREKKPPAPVQYNEDGTVKRGRGRPRKYPLPTELAAGDGLDEEKPTPDDTTSDNENIEDTDGFVTASNNATWPDEEVIVGSNSDYSHPDDSDQGDTDNVQITPIKLDVRQEGEDMENEHKEEEPDTVVDTVVDTIVDTVVDTVAEHQAD